MSASFVSPDVIRRLFAQAMSRMYRTEVPLYGTLVELVERINAQVLARTRHWPRSCSATTSVRAWTKSAMARSASAPRRNWRRCAACSR
jgi:uncharacterized glyoxalase superfamily metalloenzyme YdcJ